MNNVYIEYSSPEYEQMFRKAGFSVVHGSREAPFICFTGGSDVSPHFYGEQRHPYSSVDVYRDERESDLYQYAIANSIPMVGICRGGQFLNVMNSGKMYQHIEGHGGSHYMQDQITKECILVSSTHHQMMRPTKEALIVASTDICVKAKEHMTLLGKNPKIISNTEKEPDIEVVFYPTTNSLCFQPHPEFCNPQYERMTAYFFELINRYLVKA